MQKKYPSQAELIGAYKLLRKRLRKQPSKEEYFKHCYPQSMIFRVCGANGWRKLVLAGGGSVQGLRGGQLQPDHLISDFLNLQQKLGRRPKIVEYTSQCHTPKVLDCAFGSPGWRNMLKQIGPEVLEGGIDAEHLIQDYLSLRKKLGDKITQEDFCKHQRHTYKVIKRVFGNWPWRALRSAAEDRLPDTATSPRPAK